MFDICVLSESELGAEGQRLGRITIGDFSERFACHDADAPVESFPAIWKSRLASLVDGENAVALVHDPRFAWIVYREGDLCFVQQCLAIDENFYQIPKRQTVNEDGDRISEWFVPLSDVAQFINA